jgi:DNA-3-methyladenine glycosylase I
MGLLIYVKGETHVSSYCDSAPGHPLHGPYHDGEYGFPLTDERKLLERLALEIFQAGLSWEITLIKRPTTVAAFNCFDVDMVSAYSVKETARLLADPGIIRNKLKVAAIIENANRIKELREKYGGFSDWIAANHPLIKADWVNLFKKTFKFTGGEIVNEFLMSIGYLPGAHRDDCPVHVRILKFYKPAWRNAPNGFYDEA